MLEKQEIFTSEFLEVIDKFKNFVANNIVLLQAETPRITVKTSNSQENRKEELVEESITNSNINELATNVAEIIALFKVAVHKDQIIDDLHKELMQYKDGLKEAIILPLLKAIVREYDRVSKQYSFFLEKSHEEPQSELFNKLLSEFEMLSFSLLNLLNDYNIEQFDFNIGDAHDIKMQKIIEVIETEDVQKDCTVMECIACGFRNMETSRLLRQAEVKIYKIKK